MSAGSLGNLMDSMTAHWPSVPGIMDLGMCSSTSLPGIRSRKYGSPYATWMKIPPGPSG